MVDFTFTSFIELLNSFIAKGYSVKGVDDFISSKQSERTLILRHDIDRYPNNALKMAKLEYKMGVRASYYFRIIPSVYKEDIIKKVRDLGHEVAYHYEDLSLVKGDYQKAIKHFENGLSMIRKFAPAKTICMHGSPLSKWDNKKLWDKYNYKDFGIIGDTSYDIDYNKVFYISDNGWGWNNSAVSVRDKVDTSFKIPINSTEHLMELIKTNQLPDQVMINAHPDTFFDPGIKWYVNMLKIKSKNVIKRQIVKYNLIK